MLDRKQYALLLSFALLLQYAYVFQLASSGNLFMPLAIVSLLGACVLVWKRWHFYLIVRRPQIKRSALALLFSTVIFVLPFLVAAQLGVLTFTYGNMGLEPEFMGRLPGHFAFCLVAHVIGIEVVFRLSSAAFFQTSGVFQTNNDLPTKNKNKNENSVRLRLWSEVLFQALAFTVWLAPILWQFTEYGEREPIMIFGAIQFLIAVNAGLLFRLSQGLLASGLWTGFLNFCQFYVLSDVDIGADTAFHLTSSTQVFYLIQLLTLIFLAVVLAYWGHNKSQTRDLSPGPE